MVKPVARDTKAVMAVTVAASGNTAS